MSKKVNLKQDYIPKSIRRDLDFIRELVEYELGYPVKGKERHPKLMMAQRLFVNLINLKYKISKPPKPALITRPLLASYIGYDSYISIDHFLFNFNHFLTHHPELEEKWNILSNLIMNNDISALRYLQSERRDMLSKVDVLNRKITKLKKDEKSENKNRKKDQKEISSPSYYPFWR